MKKILLLCSLFLLFACKQSTDSESSPDSKVTEVNVTKSALRTAAAGNDALSFVERTDAYSLTANDEQSLMATDVAKKIDGIQYTGKFNTDFGDFEDRGGDGSNISDPIGLFVKKENGKIRVELVKTSTKRYFDQE